MTVWIDAAIVAQHEVCSRATPLSITRLGSPSAGTGIRQLPLGLVHPERIMARLGMRSPDEYEAAFYADTTNANLESSRL